MLTNYLIPGTNKIEYKEGIFVGYRGYEKNNVKPLFPLASAFRTRHSGMKI